MSDQEPTSAHPPRVTVVLITHDQRQRTEELCQALFAFAGEPFELLVVDNASQDDTPELLRELAQRPGVRVLLNAENRLLSTAMNQALEQVTTEYVVYLCARHALVCGPGWLDRLVAYMELHPQIELAGDVWDPGYAPASRLYRPGWVPGAQSASLLHVQGGAFIARRTLFVRLGGFNAEEFPHGGTDVELSYRLLSHGLELGRCPGLRCPPAPLEPLADASTAVVHPATPAQRERVRRLVAAAGGRVEVTRDLPPAAGRRVRPAAVVFCERLANQSFCEAVVRELSAYLDVRPCGPGWPVERLRDVDLDGVAFYLELDAVSGSFVRPIGLEDLRLPKFAWLIDTHKKTDFHRQIAREVDLTFYAHHAWGHVLQRPCAWLPLHADQELFRPLPIAPEQRRWDVAFVGSQLWRAEALEQIGRRHGLEVLVRTTTGPREKAETAAIYAQSRLVFNRHVGNDLNFRVFEAMACGRVLLTDAQPNGQYELFQDDRHLVYYKDEADLERLILELLGDPARRERIELAALELAHARHTTRHRVEDLLRTVGHVLAAPLLPETAPPAQEVRPSSSALTTPIEVGSRPVAGEESAPLRCLVLAGPEPAAVSLLSYAERLGLGLAQRGHAVSVLRLRRRATPASGDGPLLTLELDPGQLPIATTQENRLLAPLGALQRAADGAIRGQGSFDLLLAEGSEGAILAPSLARRYELPAALALEDCSVSRHGNRLTRAQLYRAELEQWGLERVDLALVPTEAARAAMERHYAPGLPLQVSGWPEAAVGEALNQPGAGQALLPTRLGLPREYVLVIAPDDPHRVQVCDVSGVLRHRWRDVRGPALAALARGAYACLQVGPLDLTGADVRAVSRRWAVAPDLGRAALASAASAARPERRQPHPLEAALDALEELARVRARRTAREVVHA